jgi:hypothetical protein
LVDGRAAGTWSSRRRGRRGLEISVRLFADATSVVRAAVEREVNDVARFLDAPAHDLILESPEA